MKKCNNNCSICRYQDRCRGCSFCEALICEKKCHLCETICFNKKEISNYLKTFQNFAINIFPNQYIKLPENITVLPSKTNKYLDIGYVAIHGARFLSRNGEKIAKRYLEKGFNEVLNLAPKTKGILEFYIKDRQLEGFWDERKNIYFDLKKQGFTYVIAPNFSVYCDAPRIEHLYNIKRSSIVYNELLDHGINAIPDISWFNKADLDQWITQINKNKIRIIAFSFQNVGTVLRATTKWKEDLLGLKYLTENLSLSLDIVIAGLVSPAKLKEIYNAIGTKHRLLILNQSAYIYSRHGILSETKAKADDLKVDDIFIKNIHFYNQIYQKII